MLDFLLVIPAVPLLTVHAKDEIEPAICKVEYHDGLCMKGTSYYSLLLQNELEQHVICTKKLKVQLLTLQNSLMDGKNRGGDLKPSIFSLVIRTRCLATSLL